MLSEIIVLLVEIILFALATFGLTLVVTKATIFETKREYVSKMYKAHEKARKLNGETVSIMHFVHKIWHAWWTCPMCLGMWVAFSLCLHIYLFTWFKFIIATLAVFGLNWLFHCVENYLFLKGKSTEAVAQHKTP